MPAKNPMEQIRESLDNRLIAPTQKLHEIRAILNDSKDWVCVPIERIAKLPDDPEENAHGKGRVRGWNECLDAIAAAQKEKPDER